MHDWSSRGSKLVMPTNNTLSGYFAGSEMMIFAAYPRPWRGEIHRRHSCLPHACQSGVKFPLTLFLVGETFFILLHPERLEHVSERDLFFAAFSRLVLYPLG